MPIRPPLHIVARGRTAPTRHPRRDAPCADEVTRPGHGTGPRPRVRCRHAGTGRHHGPAHHQDVGHERVREPRREPDVHGPGSRHQPERVRRGPLPRRRQRRLRDHHGHVRRRRLPVLLPAGLERLRSRRERDRLPLRHELQQPDRQGGLPAPGARQRHGHPLREQGRLQLLTPAPTLALPAVRVAEHAVAAAGLPADAFSPSTRYAAFGADSTRGRRPDRPAARRPARPARAARARRRRRRRAVARGRRRAGATRDRQDHPGPARRRSGRARGASSSRSRGGSRPAPPRGGWPTCWASPWERPSGSRSAASA